MLRRHRSHTRGRSLFGEGAAMLSSRAGITADMASQALQVQSTASACAVLPGTQHEVYAS